MNDEMILRMYKDGFSIDYITNDYYKHVNRNLHSRKLFNGVFIPKNKITKQQARLYVNTVIYNYVMKILKEDV